MKHSTDPMFRPSDSPQASRSTAASKPSTSSAPKAANESGSQPNCGQNLTAPACSPHSSAQPQERNPGVGGPSRRDFLGIAAAAATALGTATTAATRAADEPENGAGNSLFQSEEFWASRMQPPDDGKRYGWFIDTRRCFGCHACEVSCKAENDVPLGHFIRQTIYADVGEYPQVARLFLPTACQHCEDAPCIKACPCGALHKAEGGTVAVDYNRCSGHGTCVDVCPYGAIYLDPAAKQAVKCHNCLHRLEHGLEPACVPTCPSEALHFGDLNDPQSPIREAMQQAEQQSGPLRQLRPEKQTKPRTWYAGRAATELVDRVPREGQSLSPDAYNIYKWKTPASDT